jgi:hypothetical protein
VTRADIQRVRAQLECLQGYLDEDDDLKLAIETADELIRLFGLAKLAEKILNEVHMTLRPHLSLRLKEDVVQTAAAIRVLMGTAKIPT